MNLEAVRKLDAADPLAAKRADFHLPEQTIYLDGNSLGPLPRAAARRAQQVVGQQWGQDLISSWNRHHWIDLPFIVGEKIARLLGAAPGQVVCCDSVSVNLFKLLDCALSMHKDRRVILSLQDNFPTDLYIAEGFSRLLGDDRCHLSLVEKGQLEQALESEPAVLLLTQVNFRDGEMLDMERLTRLARERGTLVIWDLSHSTGVLPLQLDRWQVDFAVGCGYKYLNGGPGAPAFLYVASRHQDRAQQALQGWMGHQAPFEFAPTYRAAEGIARFLTGTPPILAMACLDAALDVYDDVALEQLREKSVQLGELFIRLLDQHPALAELEMRSPRNPQQRGSQLAFAHDCAYGLCQELIARGVIPDFRSPNLLRVGFSPLILRFQDIWQSVEALAGIVSGPPAWRRNFEPGHKVT